jgi:hypothetical protein
VTGRPRAADSPRPDRVPDGDGVRLSTEVAREILTAVNGLSFGSVEITVHDSRVVQIERRERMRLDSGPAPRAGKPSGRDHPKPNEIKPNATEDLTSS